MRRLGAGLAAAALVLAGGVPAGAVDGTLPGGIGIAVDVETPLPDTVIPKGTTTVVGTASIGTKAATPTTSLVYVLDSSGSLTQRGWDAEKQAVGEFHRQVAQQPYLGVGATGLVAFSTAAQAAWTGPAAGPRFHDVLAALPWQDGSTNFTAGLRVGTEVANATTEPRSIMIFLSDGRDNHTLENFEGALAAVPERVDIHTVAFGPDATCSSGPRSLKRMADATGGACVQAPDIRDLPTALGTLFPSELQRLTLTVDGGPELPITDITPALPQPGPRQVRYTVETPPLDVGNHPLCVTAHGTDYAGAGKVTDCTNVIILEPAPSTTPTTSPTSTTPTSPGGPPPTAALPGNRQVSVIPRGGVDTGGGTAAP
ncbi:vWA domain-containing protein [Saccharothrix texasensis]|uniref:von Willebrand factor type A domain-containing protein n=1 Tax=Saccharothrix texasensis TaxID=103734 RepID=A0A3N1GYA3_9PSEU|nr:vWA domain-containing protein [Saccharothrix texasensis]ROP35002.1 von Willebrand factor type A domain-containing protein [Saccharothrix texasensis]